MTTEDNRVYVLATQIKLLLTWFPHFRFIQDGKGMYFEGTMHSTVKRKLYVIRLALPPGSPDVIPDLLVWTPKRLRRRIFGTVNGVQESHGFHTWTNGIGGRVRICHSQGGWDAAKTYVQVLLRAQIWIDAYQEYLATGKSISTFFS